MLQGTVHPSFVQREVVPDKNREPHLAHSEKVCTFVADTTIIPKHHGELYL